MLNNVQTKWYSELLFFPAEGFKKLTRFNSSCMILYTVHSTPQAYYSQMICNSVFYNNNVQAKGIMFVIYFYFNSL